MLEAHLSSQVSVVNLFLSNFAINAERLSKNGTIWYVFHITDSVLLCRVLGWVCV